MCLQDTAACACSNAYAASNHATSAVAQKTDKLKGAASRPGQCTSTMNLSSTVRTVGLGLPVLVQGHNCPGLVQNVWGASFCVSLQHTQADKACTIVKQESVWTAFCTIATLAGDFEQLTWYKHPVQGLLAPYLQEAVMP
jgi:hypothetical protein